ncbi:MAG: hypothetical protein E5W83_30570, partial [Mesorhizobium sp.]
YRPIVMGARFVRVTGKLQSESGVIHIVAEKIEDLTPWLVTLLEEANSVSLDSANAPSASDRLEDGHDGDPPLSGERLVQDRSVRRDLAALSGKAEQVMPKGRNFQ